MYMYVDGLYWGGEGNRRGWKDNEDPPAKMRDEGGHRQEASFYLQ